MEITNYSVYGLSSSIRASGYPKMTEINYPWLTDMSVEDAVGNYDKENKRAITLGHAPSGSAHDCFLKGIIVQADVTAPQYWWLQFGRYHFADIVSSQSKMHKLTSMDIDKQCNEYVDERVKDVLRGYVDIYNNWESYDGYDDNKIHSKDECFQMIMANCPMGLMLTARITTNYLQLKTIYNQRKGHRLNEWKVFCEWILKLQRFEELVL